MILAPLRGVTIRCFREVFAKELVEVGFTEAITPFVSAISGVDPLKDRELVLPQSINITPQFIGKDPVALKLCLERIKSAGFTTADLNCGCPFPMVCNKGRGSGILHTPKILREMLEVGCSVMGDGKFSIKARLGIEKNDELLGLMPIINEFPLRFLTVHARNAKQMYTGDVDRKAFEQVKCEAKMPVIYNGDAALDAKAPVMVGRAFLRWLGEREDIKERLKLYIKYSCAELCGERPVLGRMKELLAYWKDSPFWCRRWQLIKIARSLAELELAI